MGKGFKWEPEDIIQRLPKIVNNPPLLSKHLLALYARLVNVYSKYPSRYTKKLVEKAVEHLRASSIIDVKRTLDYLSSRYEKGVHPDFPPITILALWYGLKGGNVHGLLKKAKKKRRVVALAHLLGIPVFPGRWHNIVRLAKKQLGDHPIHNLLFLAAYGDRFRRLLSLEPKALFKLKFGEYLPQVQEILKRLESAGIKYAKTAEEHAKVITAFSESCYSPTNHLGIDFGAGILIVEGPLLPIFLEERGKVVARAVLSFHPVEDKIMVGLTGERARDRRYLRKFWEKLRNAFSEIPNAPHTTSIPGPWPETQYIYHDQTIGFLEIPPRSVKRREA